MVAFHRQNVICRNNLKFNIAPILKYVLQFLRHLRKLFLLLYWEDFLETRQKLTLEMGNHILKWISLEMEIKLVFYFTSGIGQNILTFFQKQYVGDISKMSLILSI